MNSAETVHSALRPDTHPDPAFPALHARPAQGWLNDPNGICRWDGRYHVFFQYNPASARHDAINWGHISSADLLHWDEEPVALRPQPGGPDSYGCWSGVMADDNGIPTAVYSGVRDRSGHSRVTLAQGSDDLAQWQQNGVTAAGMPDDESVTAVRDPFLFHHRGTRYAVQGAGLEDGRGALLLYNAEDLAAWKYLGIWLTSGHEVAGKFATSNIWECPQLVEVNGRWVLIVSLWQLRDERHHLSGVAHLIGRMDDDGGLPVFVPETGGRTDSGPEFYAPQVLALPDRALLWGWSWEARTEEEADAAGWAGLLTFPRELSVAGDRLVVTPARELTGYRQRELAGGPSTSLPQAAEALVQPKGEAVLELQLVSAAGARTVFSEAVTGEVRLFVDASIVEVYREDDIAATLRAYPQDGENWVLKVSGNADVRAWELGF